MCSQHQWLSCAKENLNHKQKKETEDFWFRFPNYVVLRSGLKKNSAEKEQKIYHGEQNPLFILQRHHRESFKIHLNCDRLPVIDEITGKTN